MLSCLFAARLPLDANPDEIAHRDYIRLLVRERGFVRFIPRDQIPAGEPSRDEAHQPPLYYLLCAPVYALSGGSVFAVRLVAALFQLATIALIFYAVRELFPRRDDLALGAAAFVAFLPTQAQLAGAINNDALTTLLCAAVFWRLGRLVSGGQNVGDALVLGALLGIGLLTKLSVLQLLPTLVLAYVVAGRFGLLATKRAVGLGALAIGVGLLIASPWLVRNTLLYGDPLAARVYLQTGPNFPPSAIMAQLGWTMGDYLRAVGVRSFATFWFFLPPSVLRPAPGPLLVVLSLVLGALGGVYRWFQRDEPGPQQQRTVGLFLVGIALLVPFFARFILTTFQAQGRYFLPALLPAALITTLGWSALAGRRVGPLIAGALLLVFTLYALAGGTFFG